MNKKGQIYSTEFIFAILIFLGILIIFLQLLNNYDNYVIIRESEKLTNFKLNKSLNLLLDKISDNYKINYKKLNYFIDLNYDIAKKELSLSDSNFYFEIYNDYNILYTKGIVPDKNTIKYNFFRYLYDDQNIFYLKFVVWYK